MDILKSLEELLTVDNLKADVEIQKLMDAQMFIRFEKLQEKFKDTFPDASVENIRQAAEQSSSLIMNTDRSAVRPNLKPKRTTCLIREAPATVEAKDIRKLISDCPRNLIEERLQDLYRDEMSGVWFVCFETEDDALEVAMWLQKQKAPWSDGEMVKCSMKSDHLVRSFFPANQVITPEMMSPPFMPMPFFMPFIAKSTDSKAMGVWTDGWTDGRTHYPMTKGKGKGTKGGPIDKGKGKPPPSAPGPAPGSNDVANATCEYTKEYRKYTREEILRICDEMKDAAKKPQSFVDFEKENQNVVGVFLVEPNTQWAKEEKVVADITRERQKERRKKKKDPAEEQVETEELQGAPEPKAPEPEAPEPPPPPPPPPKTKSPKASKHTDWNSTEWQTSWSTSDWSSGWYTTAISERKSKKKKNPKWQPKVNAGAQPAGNNE